MQKHLNITVPPTPKGLLNAVEGFFLESITSLPVQREDNLRTSTEVSRCYVCISGSFKSYIQI